MDVSVKKGEAHAQKTACLIVPVYTGKKLGAAADRIDRASGKYIGKVLAKGDISGKPGETLLLPDVPRIAADRVLLVGAGRQRGASAAEFRQTVDAAAKSIGGARLRNAVSALGEIVVAETTLNWKVGEQVTRFAAQAYHFDDFKSSPPSRKSLTRLGLMLGDEAPADMQHAVSRASAIAGGIVLAKNLGNTPANFCTPTILGEQARELGKNHEKLKVEVLGEAAMRKLNMGSLLSVSAGSEQEARLIVMNYQGGAKADAPVVLVGKGVTFDTGGISIKPSAQMDEMKYDMCGAASVFGVVSALADMDAPVNVVGIVPATENMPDGRATKPGDVVTSMSGQTIEILNTDAEGRLILCDALTYAARYEPAVVIDIATLTGACIIALGHHLSGVMSNDDSLAADLLAAGERVDDRGWRLPIGPEYDKQLDSPFADMANIGGRPAGTVTAACFLARFTREYTWAHLDIAGTAWTSGKNKGATGRPVRMLTEYVLSRAEAASEETA